VRQDFAEFGSLIGLDDHNTVLGYGVLSEGHPDRVRISTKGALGLDHNFDAVSRSKGYFTHPYGMPGVIMLDHDPHPHCPESTPESLCALIAEIVPSFADCMKWVMPSVGSGVYRAGHPEEDGRGKGFHLYIAVPDLSDTKRFGEALCMRLWLAGQGYHHVDVRGSLWVRCPVDGNVFKTPERIDFVNKPLLGPGLEWHKVPVTLLKAEGGYFDTRQCGCLSNGELAEYHEQVKASASSPRVMAESAHNRSRRKGWPSASRPGRTGPRPRPCSTRYWKRCSATWGKASRNGW
jgi:hypothetical protein